MTWNTSQTKRIQSAHTTIMSIGLLMLVSAYSFGWCFEGHHCSEHEELQCESHVPSCPMHGDHRGPESCRESCGHDDGGFHLHQVAPVLVQQDKHLALSFQPEARCAEALPPLSVLASNSLLPRGDELYAARFGPPAACVLPGQNLPLII